MESPQTLRRPSNWQDFETLCKKLWGEIWNCPEIQKNGRLGQEQNGVDVFGIPFGEDAFYGIQCKGKSEYNNSQFTTKEIDKEILKSKTFEPPLKKLYFATTALNDSKIQSYVRTKNIDHIKAGLFEVHLFSWETIVDLIDENKQTHDWYIKNQNYKSNKSVKLTFENNESEMIIEPKFRKRTYHYKQKIVQYNPRDRFNNNLFLDLSAIGQTNNQLNQSYSKFEIRIHNTGNEPLEKYKVFFNFKGEIQSLADNNIDGHHLSKLLRKHQPDVFLWEETMSGKVIPNDSILVGDDIFRSEDIYLKPFPKEYDIIIEWKLISKDFKETGELVLKVKPNIISDTKEILTEDPLRLGVFEKGIEDYLEDDE
ncbi:hypothetical protein [Winogradskyella arenosi]|uniref:Restriction endonuclease n=1 Tax=Winogradskyella arenosi TaxID=533325 RepID=A0A368ZAT1_9FLAO|nr:hypothetical protein [Winogradskyella arenosi]RCW89832.1 hypothetical protein DFQ08_10712 [Winogradskyella arenosi]